MQSQGVSAAYTYSDEQGWPVFSPWQPAGPFPAHWGIALCASGSRALLEKQHNTTQHPMPWLRSPQLETSVFNSDSDKLSCSWAIIANPVRGDLDDNSSESSPLHIVPNSFHPCPSRIWFKPAPSVFKASYLFTLAHSSQGCSFFFWAVEGVHREGHVPAWTVGLSSSGEVQADTVSVITGLTNICNLNLSCSLQECPTELQINSASKSTYSPYHLLMF